MIKLARPRVLIYKRTHTGDPSSDGVFGSSDCMGTLRSFQYDAVIGIGGHSYWPRKEGIAGRITWVGIGPQHHTSPLGPERPLVTFERFRLLDATGPLLTDTAPELAKYFFAKHRRFFYTDHLGEAIQREIAEILELARDSLTLHALPRNVQCKPSCWPESGSSLPPRKHDAG